VSIKPVVVAFPFLGDEVGGSHISAVDLIAGLDSTLIRCLIILHVTDGALASYLTKRGMTFFAAPKGQVLSPAHRVPRQNRLKVAAAYAAYLPRLVRFLRGHRVDVVHTNDGQMHATWAIPARISGARLLWHHRGDPTARAANILAPVLANEIVTVSNFARPSRPILPIDDRVTVLHSPFEHPISLPDRAHCHHQLCEELNLKGDIRFAGYIGVLTARKRPLHFVETIAAFGKSYPGIALHGVLLGLPEPGGDRLDEKVRSYADELGIGERIHLMGFRSPISPLMCALDALLVPAINEPFGRTLIEAMMLGTPVIATNHGGNPEAIVDGENGYLVPAESPQAFVEPLHRLLTNQTQWERVSETARSAALSHYSASSHIEGITSIYERMRN
jgi:glycosyltransferase involved in cell wall biosynthesis